MLQLITDSFRKVFGTSMPAEDEDPVRLKMGWYELDEQDLRNAIKLGELDLEKLSTALNDGLIETAGKLLSDSGFDPDEDREYASIQLMYDGKKRPRVFVREQGIEEEDGDLSSLSAARQAGRPACLAGAEKHMRTNLWKLTHRSPKNGGPQVYERRHATLRVWNDQCELVFKHEGDQYFNDNDWMPQSFSFDIGHHLAPIDRDEDPPFADVCRDAKRWADTVIANVYTALGFDSNGIDAQPRPLR